MAKTERIVEDRSPLANLLDTARFEHMYRIATAIAKSSLTPQHLKAKAMEETCANCFRVVNQAIRWGMDPFAVVDETYVVSGKLGYQGKLVAAVINARGGLKGKLRATYAGSGKGLTVTVSGQFADEDAPRTITLSVEQAATQNKMWVNDPEQKLWYSGVTKWARRHCPEILLGVLTDDDLERMQQTQQVVPQVLPNARLSRLDAELDETPAEDLGLEAGERLDEGGEIVKDEPAPEETTQETPAPADWRTSPLADHKAKLGGVTVLKILEHSKLKTLGDLYEVLNKGPIAGLSPEQGEKVSQYINDVLDDAAQMATT